MSQQKAGGGLLAKVSRHPAPSQTLPDQSIGVSHSRPNGAICNVGASRTARFAHRHPTITVAAGLLVLSAGILAAGILADHLPDLVLGACIVVLGIVCGAMLAVKA